MFARRATESAALNSIPVKPVVEGRELAALQKEYRSGQTKVSHFKEKQNGTTPLVSYWAKGNVAVVLVNWLDGSNTGFLIDPQAKNLTTLPIFGASARFIRFHGPTKLDTGGFKVEVESCRLANKITEVARILEPIESLTVESGPNGVVFKHAIIDQDNFDDDDSGPVVITNR